MSSKKRYAQVGVGCRSWFFTEAMINGCREYADFVAICDSNPGRMEFCNWKIKENGGQPVKMYQAEQFEQMVKENNVDVVIVTTGPDVTHDHYICRAMELGCDVVTEKPMTTDETRCKRILKTSQDTGRNVQVTFNYRYSPHRTQIKEMLAGGAIGEVLSVDFSWMLDTRHGADYFRRWHRKRENSGSLLVHKSTHHFDLVNWWLDDVPEQVSAFASKRYYTPQMADSLGLTDRAEYCRICPHQEQCRFCLDIDDWGFNVMYFKNEKYDGYYRDRCVFADEIDIWDNMAVNVRYSRGAILNYFLHAYSPYEGYRIAFNGTKGRLEHFCCESTYISGDGTVPGELEKSNTTITLIPEFSQPQEVKVQIGSGGHGGGDPLLAQDIFNPNPPEDPYCRKAGGRDGAYSILTGIAAYRSIDQSQPVRIADLLDGISVPE